MIRPATALGVALGVALAACKGSEPPASRDGGAREAVVARGLASSDDPMARAAKGALVLQQCNIACGARPGIDSGACTSSCHRECSGETDVGAIDRCAARVAQESPAL